jgi:alanine racemase
MMIPVSSTWTHVSLTRVRHNAAHFRRLAPRVMAVIKADAYGHGAERCAGAALAGGATQFAVARVEEALQLRHAAVRAPILVLGCVPNARLLQSAVQADVALSVWSAAQLRDVLSAASAAQRPASVHVCINTGMNRLGLDCAAGDSVRELGAAVRGAHDSGHVHWDGLFTHMACGDAEDAAPTHAQLERFDGALAQLRPLMPTTALVHAANSATAMRYGRAHFDMVRVGIALYGLAPCAHETPAPPGVLPALSWFACVAQRRTLPHAGTPVSYGGTYRTQWDGEQHVTVSVGYADGFRRCANNKIVLGDVECDVVGRVTMDNVIARVPRGMEQRTAQCSVAELIGEHRTADAVARAWNTINYEVTCAIGKRVPQIHSGP